MSDRITKNWNQNQRIAGKTVMSFIVQRNGQIADIEVVKSSGNTLLDLAAQRALHQHANAGAAARRLYAQRLPVELEFEYTR